MPIYVNPNNPINALSTCSVAFDLAIDSWSRDFDYNNYIFQVERYCKKFKAAVLPLTEDCYKAVSQLCNAQFHSNLHVQFG